jgi:UDP-N-acetylmuramate--alanine ligase
MAITHANLIGGSRHAYLIGIGGVGMSALARVLKHQGLEVSGSDSKESRTTRELESSGIGVAIGQYKIGFEDADLIIYSSAIRPDHIELSAAREMGRKVLHRAEVLSSLLNKARTSVAVTGTHGKTTTSSMISFVLSQLGKNPTCLVGGDVMNLGTNTVLGNPDLWISEVDESDKTHEMYAPNYAIVTNLEEDHIDNYKDLEELKSSFSRFLENTRDPGLVIYSEDDATLRTLVQSSGKPRLSFGFAPSADFSAQNIEINHFGSEFDLFEVGFFVRRMKLCVPGLHNVANALAAITAMFQLGIDADEIAPLLQQFKGARRRLEVKWQSGDIVVIDDYAHHPTEVRASIRALRALGKRLTVIFQPHRYSRTLYFFKEFASAFEEADELILTDIYGAGEANTENITVNCIYDEMMKLGHPNVQVISKSKIVDSLLNRPSSKGVIAFIGAGDIGELADEFANRHKSLTPA